MKLKAEQRSNEEIQQLHANLIGFLLDNPEYQWVETSDGVLVTINVLKYSIDKGIIAQKGAKLDGSKGRS